MYQYKIVKEDYNTGKQGKRSRTIERKRALTVGGLYFHLGNGLKGCWRVLEELEGDKTMTQEQVLRYLELVERKLYIFSHSGVSWKPEYKAEMEQINQELEELLPLVEAERRKRNETVHNSKRG